jgi:hypothetical protein
MCTVHADNQIPSLSKHDLPCFIKKQPHLYKDKDQVGKERGLMGRQHKHTQTERKVIQFKIMWTSAAGRGREMACSYQQVMKYVVQSLYVLLPTQRVSLLQMLRI